MSLLPSLTSERDSFAALDALLRLKASQEQQHERQRQQDQQQLRDAVLSCHHHTLSASSHVDPNTAAQKESTRSLQSQGIPGFPSSYSSALNLHSHLLGTAVAGMFLPSAAPHQHRHHFSASQLAAAQVAAALVPSSPGASLSRQLQAAAAAATAFPVGSTANRMGTNGSSLSTSPTSTTCSDPSDKERSLNESTATSIRAEKVEAALKSKPQRGKKRDDLSEKERVELTRTRNREHAKSTRMRKKARYQSLMDAEDQLKLFQHAEDLRRSRRATIQTFLYARQTMLNETADIDTPSSASSALQEVVDHLGTFQYDVHNHNFTMDQLKQTDHRQVAISRMNSWDRDIQERFRTSTLLKEESSKFGCSSFHYEVVDGRDGIAISENGTGYARVDLVFKPDSTLKSGSKHILSGILTVQFASTSSLLASATWTTTQYHASSSIDLSRSGGGDQQQIGVARAGPPDDDPSCSSSETLGYQMIHPSVVSLDLKPSPVDTTESLGPGLAI